MNGRRISAWSIAEIAPAGAPKEHRREDESLRAKTTGARVTVKAGLPRAGQRPAPGKMQRHPHSLVGGSRGRGTPGGTGGGTPPVQQPPERQRAGAQRWGSRSEPAGAKRRQAAQQPQRQKRAPTIVPYPAGVPEPIVQVGASPSRHGRSGRRPPWVMKGQGIAAGPRTQQGHASSTVPPRSSPPATDRCFVGFSLGRLQPCAVRTAAFSTASPTTTASTCAP